jgi:hypothetical protein
MENPVGTVVTKLSGERGSVSVALCTFQGSRYLREQLDSIVAQTYQPAEVIVCDDGSRDDSLAVLTEFADRAPFPVHIHRNEQQLGSTLNFEKAVRLCRGDLIALCDQDDWWHPTKLEVLSGVLTDPDVGGVFTNGLLMDNNSQLKGDSLWGQNLFEHWNRALGKKSWDVAFGEKAEKTSAEAALLRHNMVTGATVVFRTALREKILPFPVEWVHDGWLAWMIVLHSRLRAVPMSLIHYRVHSGQQIGVPGSLSARLMLARATGMKEYLAIERRFEVLIEYVRSCPGMASDDLLRQLEQKARLVGFRGRLPASYLKRWGSILALAPAYRAYAQGFKSMLKDALV